MFLGKIMQRNPNLIRAAVDLHQSGRIPANTWLIDLDGIAENARILVDEARRQGLHTYVMTKQYGRNPFVTRVALKQGLNKAVAVDIQCAKVLHRYGVPVGHIGHLNQVPKREISQAIAMKPEVMTVFSLDQARAIAEAAREAGRVQELLVRVVGPNDVFFEGQEGGVPETDLISTVKAIQALGHVRVVGTVSFPCIRYNRTKDDVVEPTPNFGTIVRAARRLRDELGVEIKQINAPGNTSAWTMKMIADNGGTHAEPGHGLLGTTPNHAFLEGLPERPTYCYVTEVSHHIHGEAYVFGGGFWSDIYDPNHVSKALVGHTFDECMNNVLDSVPKQQIIDYHGAVVPPFRAAVGATVIFGFRTQMQMTRSQVAVVAGIGRNQPELVGLFDHAGTMIDDDRQPVPTPQVLEKIEAVLGRY